MIRVALILFMTTFTTSCMWRTLHYFPAITGNVTFEGKPIENAVVEYISTTGFGLHDTTQTEKFVTDKNGTFIIPLNTSTGLIGPHLNRLETRILIYYQDNTYVGLRGVRDYMDNKGIDVSKSIELDCELSNTSSEAKLFNLNGDRYENQEAMEYKYSGICL